MSDSQDLSRAQWDLMDFLVEQTRDNLYTIIVYTADTWEVLYHNSEVAKLFASEDADSERFIEQFRDEAAVNRERDTQLDIGRFGCSLHLFEEWVLLHFSQGECGIVFGYDPATATNLSNFVSDCYPYVEPILTKLSEPDPDD